ncbi:MAG: hypothetical protein U5K79_17195 [Cyclobacteriaceae bacterium]|nr:hypothetical protein [Cyclobacteriaceae bacterium]
MNKGLAKGSKGEIPSLNQYLEKVRAKIVNLYQELTLSGKVITALAIKNKFLRMDQQEFTCVN